MTKTIPGEIVWPLIRSPEEVLAIARMADAKPVSHMTERSKAWELMRHPDLLLLIDKRLIEIDAEYARKTTVAVEALNAANSTRSDQKRSLGAEIGAALASRMASDDR